MILRKMILRKQEKQNAMKRLEFQLQSIQDQLCFYQDFIETLFDAYEQFKNMHIMVDVPAEIKLVARYSIEYTKLDIVMQALDQVMGYSFRVLDLKQNCRFNGLRDAQHWNFKYLIKRFSEQYQNLDEVHRKYNGLMNRMSGDMDWRRNKLNRIRREINETVVNNNEDILREIDKKIQQRLKFEISNIELERKEINETFYFKKFSINSRNNDNNIKHYIS